MSLAYALPFSGNRILEDALEFHGDTHLELTPSGEPATLRQATISTWIRIPAWSVTSTHTFVSAWTDADNRFHFRRSTNGRLEAVMVSGGATIMDVQSTAGDIWDPDWHHIMVALDHDQGTAADRVKLYLGGSPVTPSYAVYPSSVDFAGLFKTLTPHYVGQNGNSADYFNGIMADVNIVTEQALDPSSFGETVDGVWVWKDYTGTHGTYGMRFEFQTPGTPGENTAVA